MAQVPHHYGTSRSRPVFQTLNPYAAGIATVLALVPGRMFGRRFPIQAGIMIVATGFLTVLHPRSPA